MRLEICQSSFANVRGTSSARVSLSFWYQIQIGWASMGMYTELHYNAKLIDNAPDNVLAVLQFMVEGGEEPSTPNHELFSASRWRYMLRCDSCYFDADTRSTLRWDEDTEGWYLCIRCNLKNYENEIEKFVAWVRPFVDKEPGDFLGFIRYQETEQPTLLFAT